MPKIQKVTFLGYADAKEADDPFKAAFEVAKLCAEKGLTVVNGGGPGVMKASTLGAHEGGGKAIGITFYPADIPVFEGRDESNNVDELIVCDNYLERTLKLLEVGHVHVIFNGGTGTISEFGMAWGLARLYFGHHKPLILYGDFWQEIIFAFTKGMYIRPEERLVFQIVNKPHMVIEAISEFEKMIDKQKHEHVGPVFSI
ncbi:MAG TPA: LOG family protein [Candidatus Saccharimonadales bacterium]|nr:LOG family protein [Candidatus Saccharimonadales bacterium]